jgi:enterochelin esterase family protein
MLINDCIPFIDRTYRTKTDKWNRAMAGLSMGSLQTSIVTLKHPGVFGYAGVFSGFVNPLGGLWSDETYLSVLDDKTAFEQAYKLFFRACGDTDLVALPKFESDSRLFFDKGLSPAVSRTHIEKYYHGGHEWNVWRECLRDFAQLIFRSALEE